MWQWSCNTCYCNRPFKIMHVLIHYACINPAVDSVHYKPLLLWIYLVCKCKDRHWEIRKYSNSIRIIWYARFQFTAAAEEMLVFVYSWEWTCNCWQSKKPNAAQPSTKKPTHEPKSPDSSASSNPSSPVSSLKSVPVAHSRQSCVSKLRAARAAIEKQTTSKADAVPEDTEMPASPGSSDSPRISNRKTSGKKSAPVQKRISSETLVLIVIINHDCRHHHHLIHTYKKLIHKCGGDNRLNQAQNCAYVCMSINHWISGHVNCSPLYCFLCIQLDNYWNVLLCI